MVFGFLFPNRLADAADSALQYTIGTFGWFYLFVTFFLLSYAFYLAFGPYGKIKLGQDDDEPECSNIAWFAMLFSARMGIGLVFWGVAEPIFHYLTPPMGVEGQISEAARLALRYSFFHWGLHLWAIYTIIALAIAYIQFFYWAWWIAWAPFVGSLIARVSKGTFWFSTFGVLPCFLKSLGRLVSLKLSIMTLLTTALFVTLVKFPLGSFLGTLATLLIVTFFITSADSATFVLGMLTSRGSLNPTHRFHLE